MSPTANPFLKNISKRLSLLLVGDGTQDIADVYAMQCASDNIKVGIDHPRNRCPYCRQYGKYHTTCNYCGAPVE